MRKKKNKKKCIDFPLAAYSNPKMTTINQKASKQKKKNKPVRE